MIPEEIIEEKEDSKIKKILIILMAIFLIFLITSYIVGGNLLQILESLSESKKAENKIIYADNIIINFQENTYEKLQELYLNNQDVEIVACLKGEKINEIYEIKELFIPKISEQTVSHVSYNPCPNSTLITLHSHPYKRCIASQTDINNLKEVKQRNLNTLMVIMCQPDRFSVYE